jgi:hypothetical protein
VIAWVVRLWLLLAATGAALPALGMAGSDCTWNAPGAHPYTGSKHRAVMSFDHIRYDQRVRLSLMVQYGQPTDIVSIGRSGIAGHSAYSYDASVNGMHFGRGKRCATVTRDGWAADHVEVARAYCIGRWCVLVPDVCGNVAWTVRDELPTAVLRDAGIKHVPEPGALWLALVGLLAMAVTRRGRKAC